MFVDRHDSFKDDDKYSVKSSMINIIIIKIKL